MLGAVYKKERTHADFGGKYRLRGISILTEGVGSTQPWLGQRTSAACYSLESTGYRTVLSRGADPTYFGPAGLKVREFDVKSQFSGQTCLVYALMNRAAGT